jgi:chromate transport protein ChrA
VQEKMFQGLKTRVGSWRKTSQAFAVRATGRALWLCAVVFLCSAVIAPKAYAVGSASSAVFTEAKKAVNTATCGVQPVVLGLIGLAVLGLAASVMFGRFNWTWLFTILGASAMIVLVKEIIKLISGYDISCGS